MMVVHRAIVPYSLLNGDWTEDSSVEIAYCGYTVLNLMQGHSIEQLHNSVVCIFESIMKFIFRTDRNNINKNIRIFKTNLSKYCHCLFLLIHLTVIIIVFNGGIKDWCDLFYWIKKNYWYFMRHLYKPFPKYEIDSQRYDDYKQIIKINCYHLNNFTHTIFLHWFVHKLRNFYLYCVAYTV